MRDDIPPLKENCKRETATIRIPIEVRIDYDQTTFELVGLTHTNTMPHIGIEKAVRRYLDGKKGRTNIG